MRARRKNTSFPDFATQSVAGYLRDSRSLNLGPPVPFFSQFGGGGFQILGSCSQEQEQPNVISKHRNRRTSKRGNERERERERDRAR